MNTEYRVPAIVSAMKVLRELSQRGDQGATAAELVRATELSKSSMHNLLGTLVAEGLVTRDDRSRAYTLGPSLIALGAAASGQIRLLDVTTEKLAPLANQFELTFAVGKPLGRTEVVVIERFYPSTPVHVGVRLGISYDISQGALGKCLLAAMPEEEALERLAEIELSRHTPRTITEREALLAEVKRAREDGFAVSLQELNENNAVASPILGRSGNLELVIFALGFAEHFSGELIDEVGQAMVEVAGQIRAATGIEESPAAV